MEEMERYLGVLRQLKDFDENLAREIAARAYQEQEKMKLEVSISPNNSRRFAHLNESALFRIASLLSRTFQSI